MKLSMQSLYHRPGGEAVLPKFVDYFYDFMESLTELKSVREKYAVDLRHAGEHEYGLLKS
jgi:truncated hemoglobin YjbI